jgi:hypothetical protein
VEEFIRQIEGPAVPEDLRQYGLERITSRARALSERDRKAMRPRNIPSFVLAHRLVLATVMLLLLFVVFTSGAYAFSSAAQPGSLLYGTKLFFEHARESLALSSQDEIKLEIEYSNRRISEIQKMSDPGSNSGLERWLQEYQGNIGKASSLLDRISPDSSESLSQLFLNALADQSQALAGIRRGQPSISQLESAYGICNQGYERMRARCGMSEDAGASQQGGQNQGGQGGQNQGGQGGQDQGPGSGESGQNQGDGQQTIPGSGQQGQGQGGNQQPSSGANHQMGSG